MKDRFAKVAYGVGNLGQALFCNSTQTLLIFFYTDVLRLDAEGHGSPMERESQ
jgi:Na+/melibiose symporter-like transporter